MTMFLEVFGVLLLIVGTPASIIWIIRERRRRKQSWWARPGAMTQGRSRLNLDSNAPYNPMYGNGPE